jgi:hypothetical protein
MKREKINMNKNKKNFLIAITIISMLLIGTYIPITIADNENYKHKGFDKGPSSLPVVPLKKTTLVNFDENSYLDDYAYLASVPTAVFKEQNQLYSHPLLFYQDEYKYEDDKERSLNPRQGLNYFMEDWLKYCNGQQDQMNLINIDENKIPAEWKSKEINTISSHNIYDIAKKIALKDFSFSDEAVVAVAEQTFKDSEYEFSSELEGSISGDEILTETFYSPQADKLNPRFHEFNVPEGYKYIKARTWWASLTTGIGKESDLPISMLITIPTADPDTQFYCNLKGDEWLQVAYTQAWNLNEGMDEEKTQMYVYENGKWRLSVTDVPTFETHGSFKDILRNMFQGVTYQTDITILPGTEIEIPEKTPFGCRDANFKLTWDNPNVELGMSVIGPSGEEILTKIETGKDEQKLHIDQLGEIPEGKSYSIAVFKLNDNAEPVDFKVEYDWGQNITKEQADSLTSATEGAVLASQLNSPMLYTKTDNLPEETKDALYKLGVKKIHVIDLNNHLKTEVLDEIKNIANVQKCYKTHKEIYTKITDLSGQNDIIITSIDPWTKWLVTEKKPDKETEAALFIGPSAYIGAHHGSPVIITDNHPKLSSAVVWHTEFWKRNGGGFPDPPSAPMSLTGRQAYEYFDEIGLDKPKMESMITVAGQYDIGATWDRTFVGRAMPGRFFGTPVDTTYWISRNIFYPALIFNNPGSDRNGNNYIQGSHSERRSLMPFGPAGLKITKPEQEEKSAYPVLHSYMCYNHRLNYVFDKYYGFQYECRDDIIPGVSASPYAIDEGVVPGETGAVWPDFSATITNPFYAEKGGFSNVYSTSYTPIVENLNRGMLLWNCGTHGAAGNSGFLVTWPENGIASIAGINLPFNLFGFEKEGNPWRGYDFLMGSTETPDSMTMNAHGIIPGMIGNPNMDGLFPLGWDYTINEKPYRQNLFKLISYIPVLGRIIENRPWLMDSSYFKDGIIGAKLASFIHVPNQLTGLNIDEDLENLYSMGWILTACLPAYKYLHMTMVRHGSAFQVMDPWPTSWYAYWSNTMPRDIIIGDTIGEAYTKGISHVGKIFATDPPKWWWDTAQNVVYYGDPDLRMLVPGTEYSEKNHWTQEDVKPILYDSELNINGHMPFGATDYPHEREPEPLIPIWLLVVVIIILIIIAAIVIGTRNDKNKK